MKKKPAENDSTSISTVAFSRKVSPSSIVVVAEKQLRLDGLILNNGAQHQFQLFVPQSKQVKGSLAWAPMCKFEATIWFKLGKAFSEE